MEIETTKPHIGRMYDYVLGGHHNYEADRKAADGIAAVMPSYPKWAKLNRWFLQLVGSRWAEAGITRILDLASGLPTQGHHNESLPQARILFSDIDPLSVTYGQEILKDEAHMRYVLSDLREPAPLLETAAQFFGAERRLAVGYIGIGYFMSEEHTVALMKKLHSFCAPGSVLAATFMTGFSDNVEEAMNRLAERARIKMYLRTPEQIAEVLKPWKIDEIQPLPRWLDVDDLITAEDRQNLPMEMMGVVAHH